METTVQYDVAKMKADMAGRGWLPTDLAKAAELSDMTVSRFLKKERNNPRTAKRLAEALGHRVQRYILPVAA